MSSFNEELLSRLEKAERVPETMRRWMNGESVLAERYGLPRFEVRVRVVEIEWVIEHEGELEAEPYIVKGELREFKTYKAAKRLATKWEKQGKVVLIQFAPLVWLTQDEMPRRRIDTERLE